MMSHNHKKRNSHSKGSKSGKRTGPRAVLSAPQSGTWNVKAQTVPGSRLNLGQDNAVINVIGMHDLGSAFTTSTSGITNFAYEFQASFWSGFSSYQACFDQYRIKMIEVWIEPQSFSNDLTLCGGKLYTVVDYDDTSVLTVSAIQQYSNLIDAPCLMGRVYRFVPHVANALYGGAFTAFGNSPSDHTWIDCASNNVQHYGVKMTAEQTTFAVSVYVRSKIWFQFRNQI